jgi:hypothetical protein
MDKIDKRGNKIEKKNTKTIFLNQKEKREKGMKKNIRWKVRAIESKKKRGEGTLEEGLPCFIS